VAKSLFICLRRVLVPGEVIAVGCAGTCAMACHTGMSEELLAERGIRVDHVTVYRWGQLFTAEFIEAPTRSPAARRPLVRR
jgi:transposase-like protein